MSSIYMGVIVPCTVLLPLITAFCRYRYWNTQVKFMVAYLLLSGIFNIIAKLTAHSNNLPYLHLYTILEFLVLCAFFRSLADTPKEKVLLTGMMFSFPILSVGYILSEDVLYTFNQVPRFISSVSITLMGIYFLLKDISSVRSNYSMFLFIVMTGLLLYYSTCSTLFGLSTILLSTPKNIATMIWNTHATFNLLMYILFFVALLKLKKE